MKPLKTDNSIRSHTVRTFTVRFANPNADPIEKHKWDLQHHSHGAAARQHHALTTFWRRPQHIRNLTNLIPGTLVLPLLTPRRGRTIACRGIRGRNVAWVKTTLTTEVPDSRHAVGKASNTHGSRHPSASKMPLVCSFGTLVPYVNGTRV